MSAPGEARTPSLLFRRQTLYPIELQEQVRRNYILIANAEAKPSKIGAGNSLLLGVIYLAQHRFLL